MVTRHLEQLDRRWLALVRRDVWLDLVDTVTAVVEQEERRLLATLDQGRPTGDVPVRLRDAADEVAAALANGSRVPSP